MGSAPGDGAESLAAAERHLKAPPSRKEREKGRAPAFVRGESLGQPPKRSMGGSRVKGCPHFALTPASR